MMQRLWNMNQLTRAEAGYQSRPMERTLSLAFCRSRRTKHTLTRTPIPNDSNVEVSWRVLANAIFY